MNLESIFKKRFHGAVNIRGIDFQILYALYEGLLLIVEKRDNDSVTLEGIEDLDLKPFHTSDTFIQVKTSDDPWHWGELQKVILGFSEVLKISPDSQFRLVVNFPLRQRITQLASFDQQPEDVKKSLLKEFEKLCRKVGVEPYLAPSLINKLAIYSVSKADLLQKIRQLLIDAFDLHPETVEMYVLCLAYQFISWAIERKTVVGADIRHVHVRLMEGLSRKQQFEAYGKYLIGKIDWSPDKQPEDYFAGKRTRPGHIMLGLDVERSNWLDKIDLILAKKHICVIKAASGEGKSTLAFRYAYKHWLPEYTYIVHSARVQTEAEEIIAYLSGLSELGLPVTVLIDDVKEEIGYYSHILAGCAANGIKALVTIRNEDYERFTSWNLTDFEIVTPGFDLAEAKSIYKNLNSRIHKDAPSVESAFEQIGSPATLIEYIFLITQGQMLEERLREQIKLMRRSGENVKVELLRQMIVAHSCRVPINLNRLITAPDYATIDIQSQLIELTGEYINVEDNYINGYHWVRSNHLVKILHNQYANVAITGLKVLEYLEEHLVPIFIENLLALENADETILISGLSKKVPDGGVQYLINSVNGLFRGGERRFFIQNKYLFDEAYSFGFQGGILLLSWACLPTIRLNTLDEMVDIFGEKEINFRRLKELKQQVIDDNRGFQLVSSFFQQVLHNINQQTLIDRPDILGELLDWLYWCKLSPAVVDFVLDRSLNLIRPLDLQIEEFCMFSQGFYRYSDQRYSKWFAQNQEAIVSKLEKALDCRVSISAAELDMTYRTLDNDGRSWNDSTMYRLDRLRSAIPFCSLYKGNNTYASLATAFVKIRHSIAHNDSHKAIPVENLHFRNDVFKNQIINRVIEDHYQVKTWYDFLKMYHHARSIMINWVEYTVGIIYDKIAVDKTGQKGSFDFDKLKGLPDKMPEPLFDDELDKLFKYCRECFTDFMNAGAQIVVYLRDNHNEHAKRLLFLNYNNFLIHLPYMQEFFKRIVAVTPDYFDFSVFLKKEHRLYSEFKSGLQMRVKQSQQYWELNTAELLMS